MARMDNLLLGDLHGSVSGLTFYGVTGKQKVRMRTKPTQKMSVNIKLSQFDLSLASRNWSVLSPAEKALWTTFATNYFHQHNPLPLHYTKGYAALVSCLRLWMESFRKQVPFVYYFDALAPVTPVSVSVPAFSLTPLTRITDTPLKKVTGLAVPVNLGRIEMRNDNFVKFELLYPHTGPPPFFENDWITALGDQAMYTLWCSEALPSLDSFPLNISRYCIGSTGYIANPPNTMSLSQKCTFTLDCSSIILKNNSFPGPNANLFIYCDMITQNGTYCGLGNKTINKINAFSF